MPSCRINWNVVKDLSWLHWALTVPLLAMHLAGFPWALAIAIGLCILVGGYYMVLLKQFRPYPVQVRLAYLALLAAGMLPWMRWILWVQFVGTTAMTTVGYCPLLRLLSIAPWNRIEPLAPALLWHVFVRMPCAGGLVQWASSSSLPVSACCAVRPSRSSIACSLATRQSSPLHNQVECHDLHWAGNARPSKRPTTG